MIVLENHKLIIITPPKCGSTSLHAALCNGRVGGFRVMGPQGDKEDGSQLEIEKHTCWVPYPWHSWERVMMVRHPIDRVWSVWQHMRMIHPQFWRSKDFVEFAETVVLNPRGYWFVRWTLKQYWETVRSCRTGARLPMTNYWQLEHIQDALYDRNIDVEVGTLNPSRDKQIDIPCKTLEKLVNYYKEDMELFGYQAKGE